MPSFAAITINNGAATPVAKTFTPNTNLDGTATYQEVSGGVQAGYPKILVTYKPARNGATANKVTIRVMVPKVVSYNDASGKPVTKVDYTNFCAMDFTMPEGASLDERKDLLAYAKNLLATATITSVITGPEGIWG